MSHMLSPWLAVVALFVSASVRGDDVDAATAATERPSALALESSHDTAGESKSVEVAEQRRLVEELHEQQAAERRSEAAARGDTTGFRSTAPFREVRAIEPPVGAGQILAFHPLTDGSLVIATGAGQRYGAGTLADAVVLLLRSTGAKPKPKPTNQLIWVDASGAQRQAAPLPFACKGVTVAPDGAVIAVVAVADGLVLVGDRDPGDRDDVFHFLDADTGERRWSLQYTAEGRLDYGNSPRVTPLVHDGRAYLLGAFGHLQCVSLADGSAVWERHLRDDFHAAGAEGCRGCLYREQRHTTDRRHGQP